jgi:uncharacterized protein DUF6079
MAEFIKELFENRISRRIEEVIKVDQNDEQIISEEIKEYVATNSIRDYYTDILDRYRETPNKPHEGVGVWVSGFFGSGKSSFAKMLGLALENRLIQGERAAKLFGQRTGDPKVQALLANINEQIPTEAVIFDVSTDRGIRSGNQTITEIMYRLFLKRLGYAGDLDLAELEITLEAEGRLALFKETFARIFDKEWDFEKGKIAFAVQQASRVMSKLDPETYPKVDSWREAALRRADITPGLLAERCLELMKRRSPDKSLIFVIDEVGQFVARDVQKMLDLQGVVQNLGRQGRGKLWLIVTSQEKLTELVGGLDDKRVELARLMDRFPLQVHLEPSDISEVTSRRVLSKSAKAQKQLRELFERHRGRLTNNTILSADFRLPELTAEGFIDLYPLLPYQVDLIIQVVSGLRTQGGASKHVGGANRTIIKLAQQLLIHPDVNLSEKPIGALATIDQIYDLVAGNIASEIRGKIDEIKSKVDHPLAQPVAKAICLLQYVRSVHRTAENIAASLHPAVDADSRLPEVNAALDALEKSMMIRRGQDGYRIPTPAEDDWERQRASVTPKPADVSRIHSEIVQGLWQPQPSHNFLSTKIFKAGLFLNGREIQEGDISFHLSLADEGRDYEESVAESRRRSQTETKSIFWVTAVNDTIDRETIEIFRSKDILERKGRTASTKDETALIGEERRRLSERQAELRRLIKQACLTGVIFFRGNDRSPDDKATEVDKTAAKALADAAPEVFDRFEEAAARVKSADLDALMTTENLRGLPQVFTSLKLVREQNGPPVFNTESGPLAEVLARIADRTSYGETASGRWLTDEFSKEPFGWDFDIVRMLVVSLIRAGKIEATSKGQTIDNALSIEARNTFANNNLFRQASFQTKQGVDFSKVIEAYDHFKEVFGRDIPELEQTVVANAIREELAKKEQDLHEVHTTMVKYSLPGASVLQGAIDQIRAIRNGGTEHAIHSFNSSYKALKEAIKRSAELNQKLTDPRLLDLERARTAIQSQWPFLQSESDLNEKIVEAATKLEDLLKRETFYKEFPAIDQCTKTINDEFQRRHHEAVEARANVYEHALHELHKASGWEALNEEQRQRVSQPLSTRTERTASAHVGIPELRADMEACGARLNKAIVEMLQMVDGARLVTVKVSNFFNGGVDDEEQLDAALTGLREECIRLIATGKKVLVR